MSVALLENFSSHMTYHRVSGPFSDFDILHARKISKSLKKDQVNVRYISSKLYKEFFGTDYFHIMCPEIRLISRKLMQVLCTMNCKFFVCEAL